MCDFQIYWNFDPPAWKVTETSVKINNCNPWLLQCFTKISIEFSRAREQAAKPSPLPGGGGTPLYKPFRYVPPQRVGFLGRFCLKTGEDFAHFSLESGMVYEGTTIVYQCVRRFNSKWIRKKV